VVGDAVPCDVWFGKGEAKRGLDCGRNGVDAEPSSERDARGVRDVRYAWPAALPRQLSGAPLLESWDGKQYPAQIRLAAYVDELRTLIATDLAASDGKPLAIALEVGRPATANVFSAGDLDNHLTPVARAVTGVPVVSFWAAKRHGDTSTIAVGPAAPLESAGPPWLRAEMTASAQTSAYKEQLADPVGVHDAVSSSEPVELEICFRVGPPRNWVALWKPTIDALGGLLGVPDAVRRWHPNDGRIVRLGLHQVVDDNLGNRVCVAIWATVGGRTPDPVIRELPAASQAAPPSGGTGDH
jgi:hypothetical protein